MAVALALLDAGAGATMNATRVDGLTALKCALRRGLDAVAVRLRTPAGRCGRERERDGGGAA